MGLLTPICYATDGNKIYGYGFAGDQRYHYPNYVNYLIVSNSNPAPDLSDLTWSVVSTINRNSTYYLLSEMNVYNDNRYSNCAVDDQGVFSIIAGFSTPYFGAPANTSTIRGLQYRPSGYNGINTSSTNGTWVNFDVYNSTGYQWDLSTSSQLAVFKDPGSGTNTVMHLTTDIYNSNGFYIATLSQPVGTSPLMMTQSPFWAWPSKNDGLTFALTLAGGKIYAVMDALTAEMNVLPITSPSLVMPNTTARAQYGAAILNSQCGYYFVDIQSFAMGDMVITSCTDNPPVHTNISYFNQGNFVSLNSIQGVLKGAVPVPVLNGKGGTSFIYYGNVNGNISSVILTGTNAGAYIQPNRSVQVSGPFGNDNPWAISTDRPTHTSTSDASSSSSGHTGMIAGIVAAIVLIAGVVAVVIWKRKKRLAKGLAMVRETITVTPIDHLNNMAYSSDHQKTTKFEDGGMAESKQNDPAANWQSQPQPYHNQQHQQQQLPNTSFSHPGSGYTISATSTPQLPSSLSTQLSVQQELQQQFHFSSHPRPNVVTSVQPLERTQQQPPHHLPENNGLSSAPNNVWEPQPFTPSSQ
ncbi:hypothetical protein BGZ83_011964 [Gryganskiella cystojenkinii]|nr:hypothetical protein BGZ83_011964 [Gryganskiella cystojenkinii]